MISVNNLRTGLTIEVDGELWTVLEFLHVKPGKGQAFVRTKLRNVRTGNVIDRTFKAGERVEQARVENRTLQYLYRDGDDFVFMDSETYDQIALNAGRLGDAVNYLKENMEITVVFYGDEPIGVEPPTVVELEVVHTEPGLKGDTATGATKPATLETGLVVQVPLFVNTGDVLRIDTRTGEYLSRV